MRVPVKILIRNASIVDGTGNTPFHGDILIVDDMVKIVAKHIDVNFRDSVGDIEIDAKDLYVVPGFIDIHSHTDLANFMPNALKPKIMQGVTTEVVGQCGFSVAPMPKEKQDKFKSQLIIGDPLAKWNWSDMKEYLEALDTKGLESNLVPFVGHSTLRFAIAGDEARSLASKEMSEMAQLIEEAFDAGVFGLSFGFIYVPAIFATSEELNVIASIVAKRNGLIAVHLRSESDELIEALSEMVKLTSSFHCRLHISHLKAIGEKNWSKISKALRIIKENNLTFDHYPYIAGSTTFLSVFPPFVLEEIKNLQELTTSDNRCRLKDLFSGKVSQPKGVPWDNLPNLLGWQNIIIATVTNKKNEKYVGLNLLEIAKIEGKDPVDAAIDLIVEENGLVRMIDYHSSEESIVQKLQHKAGMIGTDTLYGGKLHPRVTGTYPRLFKKYVFDEKVVSIENMVRQMTAKPADTLGLKDRGYILSGYKADLVVFDKNFADRSTFANPELSPLGLKYVMINGKFKVKDGEYLDDVRSGEVIRKMDCCNKRK